MRYLEYSNPQREKQTGTPGSGEKGRENEELLFKWSKFHFWEINVLEMDDGDKHKNVNAFNATVIYT